MGDAAKAGAGATALAGVLAMAAGNVLAWDAEVPAAATAFWRFALAAPALLAAALASGGARGLADGFRDPMTALAGACLAGATLCLYAGQRLSTPADAALLAALSPVALLLAGALRARRLPQGATALGVAVATAGTGLTIGFGGAPPAGLGDALGAASALFFAGYVAAAARSRPGVPLLARMAVATLAATVCLTPAAAITGAAALPSGPEGWIDLAAVALASHAAGQTLCAAALRHLPPLAVCAITLLKPAAVAAVAWAALGAALTPLQALGMAVALAGVWLCADPGPLRRPRPAPAPRAAATA